MSETSAFALDFYQRKCDDFSIGSQCIQPDSRPRRFELCPSGHKAKGTTSPRPAAEPIPASRFTRNGDELHRQAPDWPVPCIRPRRRLSSSEVTGGRLEDLVVYGPLALGREKQQAQLALSRSGRPPVAVQPDHRGIRGGN